MKKTLLIALVFAVVSVGCKSQIPPATTHVVNLTFIAPSSCTIASPCTFAIFRCSASATACGDPTNSAWSEITNSTNRISGTAYTDNGAAGLTAYYAAETYQASAHSGPSNIVGPLVVPASPLAPVVNGTTAELVKPALKPLETGDPQIARLELKAVVR